LREQKYLAGKSMLKLYWKNLRTISKNMTTCSQLCFQRGVSDEN